MFTELDRFTEAPGGPHFILITKDMRKLSWTAVSTYGSDFWNTCLIPCYSYRSCFIVMITIPVPVPICYVAYMTSLILSAVSAVSVGSLQPQTKPFGPQSWAPAWLLHSVSFSMAQLLGLSWCSSLLWVNIRSRSGTMVCPHKISGSMSSSRKKILLLSLASHFPVTCSSLINDSLFLNIQLSWCK